MSTNTNPVRKSFLRRYVRALRAEFHINGGGEVLMLGLILLTGFVIVSVINGIMDGFDTLSYEFLWVLTLSAFSYLGGAFVSMES